MEGNITEEKKNSIIKSYHESSSSIEIIKMSDNLFEKSNINQFKKGEKYENPHIENNKRFNDKNNQDTDIKNYNNTNISNHFFENSQLDQNLEKKLIQKKLKHLYKKIDSCSSLLWSHDNHITGKRLRSENDQEDNKLNWKNRETTQTGYGEIALGSMTSLYNLFQNISKLISYNCQKSNEFENLLIYQPEQYNMTCNSAFLDIGSGFGKPVFHSALQVGCYSKGIEVVPARAEFCLDFFYEFINEKKIFEEIESKFRASFNNEINKKYDENYDDKNKNDDQNEIINNNAQNENPNYGFDKNQKENNCEKIEEQIKINLEEKEIEIMNKNEKMQIDYEIPNLPNYSNKELLLSNTSSSASEFSNKQNNELYNKKENPAIKTNKTTEEEEINFINFTEDSTKISSNNNQINSNIKENSNKETSNGESKQTHNERNYMFHELKKISGDSYLNSFDFNLSFSQRNLRKKKADFNSTSQLTESIVNNNKNTKQGKRTFIKNSNRSENLQIYLNNIVKLNDLNVKYYNEILKDKNQFFIELKINPEIIYEDSFIESLILKKNFQLNSEKRFSLINEKKGINIGLLFPEYIPNNLIKFGNHFILNDITIEITAINDLIYSNVLKLINNCLFCETLETNIAKNIGVYYEDLKVKFDELTNEIENLYVLDLINMTNTYFYVGKKKLDAHKFYNIIKKSLAANEPDILEYTANYLILNKSKFPFLQNKENFNSLNFNFDIENPFDYVNVKEGKIRNVKLSYLLNKETEKKGKNPKVKNNKNNKKIIDLYEELEKQLQNKHLEYCNNNYSDKNIFNNLNKIPNNFLISKDQEKLIKNPRESCEEIAEIPNNSFLDEISLKKASDENIKELANDTKMLKEVLVDFKYNYSDDWVKKLFFVSEDATKCKAYMTEKKVHFTHIYSYNKLMSKECRSKIAKILNKTKFNVLAWYSNPKQTKKAGLKNFTFLCKFPMQSTSTEKFHVYVYIKTK